MSDIRAGRKVEYFGQLALKYNYVTLSQVREGLDIQAQRRARGLTHRKLGRILVDRGYLRGEDVWNIFRLQESEDGHEHIGGFQMAERIGLGGMGSVYRARQLSMDRVVALKILKPALARKESSVHRFLREARISARLHHPNIVLGIDAGESKGLQYFAMEYVSGGSVKDRLNREGPLNEADTLRVTHEVALALAHARTTGLVHRDVKPANILLTPDGTAKLGDLGLTVETDAEQTGRRLGTPDYISPEQARGDRDVDSRSDLYSLGATMFHMVTGEPPFPGRPEEVIAHHLQTPARSPRTVRPEVSQVVCDLVARLMAKSPEDRMPHPGALAARLSDIRENRERSPGVTDFEELDTIPTAVPKAVAPPLVAKTPSAPLVRNRVRRRKSSR